MQFPADEALGHGVEEVDAALGVGADDGVPDARQRDVQPLPLVVRHLAGGGFFGQSPGAVFRLLLEGTWGNAYGFGQVIYKATTLTFTGLSFALAARAGLFFLFGFG